ncbi:MAG: hypothetical protein KA508_06700 [Gammaproteobacteria bacterium]|nr:hypothetical protein [Gammaproteobacteria bacterium]
MEKNNRIEKVINKLIFLLKSNYEDYWCSILEYLLNEFHNADSKEEVVKKILSIYKGGMGYFTDLCLSRNHIVPIGASLKEIIGEEEFLILKNESAKLKKLRTELYEACMDYEKCSSKKEVVDNVYPLHGKG